MPAILFSAWKLLETSWKHMETKWKLLGDCLEKFSREDAKARRDTSRGNAEIAERKKLFMVSGCPYEMLRWIYCFFGKQSQTVWHTLRGRAKRGNGGQKSGVRCRKRPQLPIASIPNRSLLCLRMPGSAKRQPEAAIDAAIETATRSGKKHAMR